MKADNKNTASFNHCVYFRGFDIESQDLIGHNSYGEFRQEIRIPYKEASVW